MALTCRGSGDIKIFMYFLLEIGALKPIQPHGSTIPATKSLKEQTKTCMGQAKFKDYLSQGQLEFKLFSNPTNVRVPFWDRETTSG